MVWPLRASALALAVLWPLVPGGAHAQYVIDGYWNVPRLSSTHVGDLLQYANAFCGTAKGNLRQVEIVWTGDCRAGWLEGKGVLKVHSKLWYPNPVMSMTFTGSFERGRAEGPARVDFNGGTIKSFEGLFHDSQPNGRGILVDWSGMRVEGDYVYDSLENGASVDYIDGSHLDFAVMAGGLEGSTTLRYRDGTTVETRSSQSGGFYIVKFADGGRLVQQQVPRYNNDGAVYCTPQGRRIAGKYVPADINEASVVPAVYPSLSRRLKEEGTVEIAFIVDKDGSKRDVAIHRSAFPRLDNAALTALAKWSYRPTTINGYRVETHVIVGVTFDLDPIMSQVPVVPAPTRRFLGGLDRCPVRY